MIDWERTERETGFGEEYFEKYPKSNKKVFAICDDCGKTRWIQYSNYYDLCRSCGRVKNNSIETISDKSIDWIKTEKETGFDIKYFERRPGSSKEIWRICKGGCGTGDRWISYNKYHDLCNSCERKKRYKNPEARKKQSDAIMGHEVTEQTREKIREAAIKQFEDPEQRRIQSELKKGKMVGKDNPFYGKQHSEETCKKMHESQQKRFEDPKESEKISATKQGIPYEEWENFVDKSRPHLTPINACIQLNQRFPGSEGHHIMRSVVIFVPRILHRSVWHNFKTGVGISKINELAFNFLLGSQW